MIYYINAIQSLIPNAQCAVNGDCYEGIIWHDDRTLPSKEQVDAEFARLQANYQANEYQRQRASEYPNITDYIDGVVKGDQAQIDKYIADCLAVKAKYPKGVA